MNEVRPAIKATQAFFAASRRLGANPLKRLRWLVEFAQRKDRGPANKLGPELCAFLTPEYDSPYDLLAPSELLNPSTDLLNDLSVRIREGIAAVVGGQEWREGPLALIDELRPTEGLVGVRYEGKARDCFLAKAMDLVAEQRARLRACPTCGQVFIRRRRAKYCSSRCSANARYTRWRELRFGTGPEAEAKFSNWRHTQYVKTVRQHQSGARVLRRRQKV